MMAGSGVALAGAASFVANTQGNTEKVSKRHVDEGEVRALESVRQQLLDNTLLGYEIRELERRLPDDVRIRHNGLFLADGQNPERSKFNRFNDEIIAGSVDPGLELRALYAGRSASLSGYWELLMGAIQDHYTCDDAIMDAARANGAWMYVKGEDKKMLVIAPRLEKGSLDRLVADEMHALKITTSGLVVVDYNPARKEGIVQKLLQAGKPGELDNCAKNLAEAKILDRMIMQRTQRIVANGLGYDGIETTAKKISERFLADAPLLDFSFYVQAVRAVHSAYAAVVVAGSHGEVSADSHLAVAEMIGRNPTSVELDRACDKLFGRPDVARAEEGEWLLRKRDERLAGEIARVVRSLPYLPRL